MDLKSWVAGHPKGRRGKAIDTIAAACGVQASAVRHWLSGRSKVRPEHWPAIQRVTRGKVKAASIRPEAFESAPTTAAQAQARA